MEHIKELDKILETGSTKEKGISGRAVYAYKHAIEHGLAYPDISDCIFEEDIPGIVETFRKFGIKAFTYSSGWSGAIHDAYLFTEAGCTLEGMLRIEKNRGTHGTPEYTGCLMFSID